MFRVLLPLDLTTEAAVVLHRTDLHLFTRRFVSMFTYFEWSLDSPSSR